MIASTNTKPTDQRETLVEMLRAFINSRPGFDPRNYGSFADYRSDSRSVTMDRDHALTLLAAVAWRQTGIPLEAMRAELPESRRLSLTERADGSLALNYTAGQYYPTEYRRAVCSALASMLWRHWADCYTESRGHSTGAAQYARDVARKELGRTIANRYFN